MTFWREWACFNWNTMHFGISYQFIGKREGQLELLCDELRHFWTRLRWFAMIYDHFVMIGVDFRTWDRELRHSVMSLNKLKAIFRWVGSILRGFASIWLDFGTICEDWRHFVAFGGEREWLETNKRSRRRFEGMLGWIELNVWPSRKIESICRSSGIKFWRFEVSRSSLEAIWINLSWINGEERRFEALCGVARRYRATWSNLATTFGDSSEIWDNLG